MITVALIRWVGRIPKKTHFCDMRTCEMGNTEQGTGAQTVRLSRGNIRIALRIDRQQWGCPVSRITAYVQPLMEWRGIGSGGGSGSGS